jgi:hypothetical protein
MLAEWQLDLRRREAQEDEGEVEGPVGEAGADE